MSLIERQPQKHREVPSFTVMMDGVQVRMPKKLSSTHAMAAALTNMIQDAEPETASAIIWDIHDCIQNTHKKFEREYQDPIARARAYHQAANIALKKEKEDLEKRKLKPSCKSGCSACCNMLVVPTNEEVQLLATYVTSGKVTIDESKLEEQAGFSEDADEWFKYAAQGKAGCVFLGSDKRCQVYADRPLACRVHFSIDPPKKCEPGPNGEISVVRNIFMRDAQIIASAAIQKETGNQSLPSRLYNELKKQGWGKNVGT